MTAVNSMLEKQIKVLVGTLFWPIYIRHQQNQF